MASLLLAGVLLVKDWCRLTGFFAGEPWNPQPAVATKPLLEDPLLSANYKKPLPCLQIVVRMMSYCRLSLILV